MEETFFSKKSYFVQFLYLLFFLIAGMVLFSVFTQGAATLIWGDTSSLSDEALPGYYRFSQTLSSIGIWLLPSLLFGYLSTHNIFKYARAHRFPNAKSCVQIIVLSVCLLPVVSLLAAWNESLQLPEALSGIEHWMRDLEKKSDAILRILTADASIATLLVNLFALAFIPALCEEFFFQGTLQPFFEKSLRNEHVAVLLTAFIFSAIHFEFFGFIPRFLLGIYLGYLWVWSRSLWLPFLAHFLHNALSVILTFLAAQRNYDLDSFDIASYTPYIALVLIICIIEIYRVKRSSPSTENS